MGHTVMACVRRCNKVNPQNFGIEVYFYDLGLRANTPSTVRNTIGLLENRLTANINAVGFYLHPRLPQFNPAADKKLVFEDLGAKIYYARILATLATDPNLEAYVERNATPASQAKAKKGLFGFIFGGDGKSKKKKGNALRNDKLGVDFFEALTILLRNPSGRVLLEVIVGLSRRSWASWIDVPVPSHALYDAPDYDDARLAGDVDIDYDDDSDEEFLQDDKFAKSSNQQELQSAFGQPQGPQGPAYLGKKEKRKLAREQQAQLNAPFYLRKLGEGMIPALEVVMRRILGGMVKDDPCLRFGALRAAVAIARAKLYTDTPEEQELLNKAKSEYYGTSALPSTQQQPGALPQQGVPQQMTRPHGLLPDEGMPTFEDDNQQHVLEPLTKHLVYLLEDEPSLYVRCKSAEAFLLFIAAGAGSSIEDKLEEDEGGEVERQSAGFRDRRIRPGTSFEEDRRNQRGPPLHEQGEERNMVDNGGNPNDVQRDQPRGQPEGPGGPPRGPPLMGPPGTTPEDAKPPPPPPLPPLIRFFRPFLCNERMKGHVALDALQPFLESLIFEVPDVAPWLAIQVVDLLEDCAFYHGTKGWCGYLLEAWENVLAIATIPCAHAVRDSVRRCAEALPERERLSATSAQFLRRRVLDLTVLSVGAGELMAKGVPTPLPQVVGSEMESHFSLIYHGILMGPSPESRQCFVDALGGAAVLANDPFRINAYEKLCELRLARGLGLRAAVDFVLCALDTLYSTRERLAEARLKLREQGGITNRNREEVWLQGVWKLAAEASAAAGSLLATPPPPGWQPLGADAANDVRAAEELLGDFRKFRISGEDPEANLEDHGLMPPERRDTENGNPAQDPRMDPRSDPRMDQRGDPRNDQRGDPRAIQQNERVGNGPHPPPGRR
mmetsp:Transcript_14768/g.60003  ORF Transcript_14768/g.60003 Transcript_14768/m.60003 type:complete len:895 (-) Transcript_14768:155-2839(-)